MLHYSRYNRELDLPDGRKVVYNFMSGQKLILSGFLEMVYHHILEVPDSKTAAKWKKMGFLVEGDEQTKLQILHHGAVSDCRRLSLTICPTRSCNFRCPYCFEEHLGGCMSEAVQQKLIDFVKNFIEENHPKKFSVTWFGGEPLLYPDIIRRLSGEFLSLCEKGDVSYSASIITNGYFLTQENADMLEAAQVDSVQITLDGPKELNDQTRILANGQGSFDVIIGNLKTIRTGMKIHVRCNTYAGNQAGYGELKKMIEDLRGETGNNITSYPAFMDAEISANEVRDQQSINYDGYLEWDENSKIKNLEQLRFRPTFCMAERLNSFVVREDGTLCRCWNDVTIQERTVASLLEDPYPLLAQLDREWGQKYLGLDVLADEECRECQLLPVCSGGCPAKRLDGKKNCYKKLDHKVDELIIESCLKKA